MQLLTAKALVTADFVKVNLEWDETGQQTRLRRGLIEVEGVMPVLVQRMEVFAIRNSARLGGSRFRHQAFIIPPAVIESTSGEGIWSGRLKTQPIKLTDLGNYAQRVCLNMIADNAGANIRVASHVFQNLPDKSWRLWKDCDTRAANHISEPMWRALDFLTQQFCLCNTLRNGCTMFDSMCHIKSIVDNAVIKYELPDPQIRAQNELLLKATFLHASDLDEDENWEGTPLEFEHRLHAAKFLLDMDTGPWSSDEIVHHCQVGCCVNAAESRAKLWVAIQAVAFRRRAVTPVISRWTTCVKSSRALLLQTGLHRLLQRGFASLFGYKRTLHNADTEDIAIASEYSAAMLEASSLKELHFKMKGARSDKAWRLLNNDKSRLLCTLL